MKRQMGLGCLLALVFNSAVADEAVESVILYSTYKDQGSVWSSARSYYFKAFNTVVLNVGNHDVELSKVCYSAYDAKGNVYALDTMDEALSVGVLPPGKTVQGFYQFTGKDEGVFDAFIVKAAHCPK